MTQLEDRLRAFLRENGSDEAGVTFLENPFYERVCLDFANVFGIGDFIVIPIDETKPGIAYVSKQSWQQAAILFNDMKMHIVLSHAKPPPERAQIPVEKPTPELDEVTRKFESKMHQTADRLRVLADRFADVHGKLYPRIHKIERDILAVWTLVNTLPNKQYQPEILSEPPLPETENPTESTIVAETSAQPVMHEVIAGPTVYKAPTPERDLPVSQQYGTFTRERILDPAARQTPLPPAFSGGKDRRPAYVAVVENGRPEADPHVDTEPPAPLYPSCPDHGETSTLYEGHYVCGVCGRDDLLPFLPPPNPQHSPGYAPSLTCEFCGETFGGPFAATQHPAQCLVRAQAEAEAPGAGAEDEAGVMARRMRDHGSAGPGAEDTADGADAGEPAGGAGAADGADAGEGEAEGEAPNPPEHRFSGDDGGMDESEDLHDDDPRNWL